MPFTFPSVSRRGFLVGCALLLASCAQPQLTGEIAGGVKIRAIKVATSSPDKAVTGRINSISKQTLASDATRVLTERLATRTGTVAADLSVDIREVVLVAPAASALAPLQSYMKAMLSVTERGTGKVLVAPTEITAYSARLRMGGIVGVATAPSMENDYKAVLEGLANAVEKRLYGEPK